MKLNDQQKFVVRKHVFECFEVKSVLENSDDEFENADWDEAYNAIDDYVRDMYWFVLDKEGITNE